MGTALGIVAWFLTSDVVWLMGAVLLISVVPITIFFIKPINDQLLDDSKALSHAEVESLLHDWNPRHWVRTIVSGMAFVFYLYGMSN